MNNQITRIRQPVKREGAERYLRYTLLSFAASVIVTRAVLNLTGFPQVGGGGLHIAHVLWGGLLLFGAALVPVALANRWALTASAILSGLGVGLFIDEVGKFITQNNDYFYPAAAPIIYAFFLLVALVYLETRRLHEVDPRSELYGVLEDMEEVLDQDLSQPELDALRVRLQRVAGQQASPQLSSLAQALLDYLARADLAVVPHRLTLVERAVTRLREVTTPHISRRRLKVALIVSLAALGALGIFNLAQLLFVATSPQRFDVLVGEAVQEGQVTGPSALAWFTARLALDGAVGALLVAAAALLLAGRERLGLHAGYLALLLALTTLDLVVFYFDQFSTIVSAILQFSVLRGVLYYRRQYLPRPPGKPTKAPASSS